MICTIIKGFLIKRIDFDAFDEILTFVCEDGQILTLYSQGSRKINSKNAYNLIFGSLIEIEYFQNENKKIQKLKKVFCDQNINFDFEAHKTFLNINGILKQLEKYKFNSNLFDLYQKMLILILDSKNEYQIFNFIFLNILKLINKNLVYFYCYKCFKNNKIISTNLFNGWICNKCYCLDDLYFLDDEIELMFELLKYDFFEPDKDQLVFCKNIYKKILKIFWNYFI